ncbi:MAG TPA: CAP domain-containing protein, partial [Acidimicrobiales bacterium]|nr:CAP domain-containing protein [Acidimicrobiales bacterium]
MNPSSPFLSTRSCRRLATALLGVVSLVVAVTAVPSSASVSFINSQRSANGRAPLASHGGLASIAASHSREMAQQNRLFHSSGLLGKVASVLPGAEAAAENVGVGSSESEVNSNFMSSSTHRSNILGNYTHAGVGTYTGPDGRVWVTQVFARSSSASSGSSAPSGTTQAAAAPSGGGASTSGSTATRQSTSTRASRQARRAPAPP